jgi:glucan endo-1,3-alpha-glucosidase
MNWNSWPFNAQGDIIVPTADDQTLLSAAQAVGKIFLIGVSPLQFRNYSGANYYRVSFTYCERYLNPNIC